MSLLSPAALWSLAALTLPLAIHLWRRPPRTVSWGSLHFLQSQPRRWRNLRWREHLLLGARLALLTTLALGLARPVWQRPPSTRPQHWALLDPAAAPAGASRERLHALQAAGSELRLLAPGFPRVDSPTGDAAAAVPDGWSLLREADAALPPGSTLAVFTTARLASLRGVRPGLSNVRTEWIETPGRPPASPPAAPPAPPLAVLILHAPDRAADARDVAAAWQAIAQVDHRPVSVTVDLTTRPSPLPAADWIFWLGSPPVAVAARAANVLEDAAAPAPDTPPGWIVSPLAPVRLWQRGPAGAGSVYWTDGFGQPLLTRTHDAHGARWHFASRFDPAWNDLPLGSALPASLRTLLAGSLEDRRDDGRRADLSQLLPSDRPAANPVKSGQPGAEIDLRAPLWVAALLLFILERLLSHARAPRPVAAVPSSPVLSR